MMVLHAPRGIGKFWINCETKTLQEASHCSISHVNVLISRDPCNQRLHTSIPWQCCGQNKSRCPSKISNQGSSKRWLCQSYASTSSDDEYRSSRNIAISLFRRYRNVIDRGGGDNLKEFISAGVNAYALGCTDEGLRKELTDIKKSGIEIEGVQSYGGSTSLKSKIFSKETELPHHEWAVKRGLPCRGCEVAFFVDECILWLSIIFITILCTPQPTIVRWSSTLPVSADIMLQWKGFCSIIANAYYVRGMAWLPVKTLQLEQMAVVGHAEEPSVVASRMRLVFSTLEVVSPQWPRV